MTVGVMVQTASIQAFPSMSSAFGCRFLLYLMTKVDQRGRDKDQECNAKYKNEKEDRVYPSCSARSLGYDRHGITCIKYRRKANRLPASATQSQKHQSPQVRLFVFQVHEIKKNRPRFKRSQDQHRRDRQSLMPKLACCHQNCREQKKEQPDPDECP